MKFTDLYYPFAIVLLGLNAWATVQLLKEFRLFRLRSEAGREGKEGQTINVNLGATGLNGPKVVSTTPAETLIPVLQESTVPSSIEPVAKEEPAPEPLPPPKPKPIASVSVTAAGIVVVKCPKCGAENSAYRSECFSCESPLG